MSKPALLLMDTKDDRREIWSLLHRLDPRRRVRYLARCCRRVRAAHPAGHGPRVTFERMEARMVASYRCGKADETLTNEVYGDVLVLSSQWGLDLGLVALELEQLGKGRQIPPPPDPPSTPAPTGAAGLLAAVT